VLIANGMNENTRIPYNGEG